MEVVIAPGSRAGRLAAAAIEQLVRAQPDAVLGLATGSSPLAVYDELARRARRGRTLVRQARAFMLDEYVGLAADHPSATGTSSTRRSPPASTSHPEPCRARTGWPTDLAVACAAYEDAIAAVGGVDLQILGIGTDGHIAFNEPGSSLASRTRIKTLTRQTREDNARFFGGDMDQVPQHCLTQGLATIMAARHLVLLATGRGKAEAVHQLVEGPVSAMWPATILQHHPHVTVLVDDAAASRLQLADYYRETSRRSRQWQGL